MTAASGGRGSSRGPEGGPRAPGASWIQYTHIRVIVKKRRAPAVRRLAGPAVLNAALKTPYGALLQARTAYRIRPYPYPSRPGFSVGLVKIWSRSLGSNSAFPRLWRPGLKRSVASDFPNAAAFDVGEIGRTDGGASYSALKGAPVYRCRMIFVRYFLVLTDCH
ncbi:MAG: hypothetical protein MZV64_52755 [Ignavibacteriales bacterium]|nr:hypothetical protein [Ignavibacteriales bacterium]